MKQVEITSKIIGRGGSTTSASPSLDLSGYALISDLLNYVTISGNEDVTGLHDFVNGLKVGGLPITKKQDDVVYLDANLVVRGGITMYAENEVDIPSILDSLPIASNTALGIASFDSTYFSVDSNGMVSLTSAPSSGVSSLGELLNVDASIDAIASVDRVLYQPAGSAMWTWRELPKDGVVGDYLPLSGGTITGILNIRMPDTDYGLMYVGNKSMGLVAGIDNYAPGSNRGAGFFCENAIGTLIGRIGIKSDSAPYYMNSQGDYVLLHTGNYSNYALPLSGGHVSGRVIITPSSAYSNTTEITQQSCALKLGSNTSAMNGYNSGLGFNALQDYRRAENNNLYYNHIHAWIGLSPCINSDGPELYDLVFATNQGLTAGVTPNERMRITHDGSVKIQRLFFGNTNEINSTDGLALCLNYEGTGVTLIGNNGYSVIVGTYAGQEANILNTLNYAPFSVFGTIFGYRYGKKAIGAAFMFDKPGSNYTGIGAEGSTDTIYFGACNKDADWVSYSQIWKFGGSILATGGITMYSDIRKKTKLQDVELSLKQIADAPLIQHYYNSDQEKTTHVGSIAQYWASMNDWFCKLDNEGFYTMEIQNCALASAISIARELVKYESKTDRTIRKMKQRIQELEDEVERLKKGA